VKEVKSTKKVKPRQISNSVGFEWFSAAFDSLPDPVVVFDRERKLVAANKAAAKLFGVPKSRLAGKHCNDIFDCEKGGHHCFIAGVFDDPANNKFDQEHSIVDRQGRAFRVYISISPLKDSSNRIIGCVETIRKLDEIENVNKDLLAQAMTDQLTGLGNRRKLYEAMEIEVSRAARHKRPYSVMMADIDHFKKYNDCYGHLAGDDALRFVADTLSKNKRKEDVVTRYGGEEFIALLPETDSAGAVVHAERVRELVKTLSAANTKLKRGLKISIGVATCNSGVKCKTKTLISEADKALYKAKYSGRNRVAHFDDFKE
jgi:diguanylate cyclase (GGDEF)-like protein/PAS domain S-box-containing protein